MEKTEITSLDLRFLIKELRSVLVGGVFRKIYQYKSKVQEKPVNQFLFEIFVSGKGNFWLYVDDKKIFLSKHKKAVPQEPPSFCMFLRKHLLRKKIITIEQNNFDRVVRIITEDNILIFELFSDGNVILCDTSNNIIMPLQIQKWKDREIRPKVLYKYPPQKYDPFFVDFDDFKKMIKKYEKATVIFLATGLGFGSVYANEICTRSDVDPNKPGNALTLQEVVNIHKTFGVFNKMTPEPYLYDDYVSPFPLEIRKGEGDRIGTFSEALDNFFSEQTIQVEKKEELHEFEEHKGTVEHILQNQGEAHDKWIRIEEESKKKADAIYGFYSTVQGAIEGVRKARDMNISWEEIKTRIRTETTPEAESIKDIREGDGIIVMDLGGLEVEVDMRKSVEENAAKYYEDVKWARRKMEGTETAMEHQQQRLEDINKQEDPYKSEVEKNYEDANKTFEQEMQSIGMTNIDLGKQQTNEVPEETKEPDSGFGDMGNFASSDSDSQKENESLNGQPQQESTEEPDFQAGGTLDMFAQPDTPEEETPQGTFDSGTSKWYERFKWFFSSDDILVVAGKDAEQNEELIKKYTESNDVVFHADIPGAAFTIIKPLGKEITNETRKEAAEFAAANSKAWSKGLGVIDVFGVPRSQVSKTPPSGEHLPKGSFMISGERAWYRDTELKLSIGVSVNQENNTAKVLSGPVMPIRKNTNYFVTIKPGFKKSTELARIVKNKILIKAKPEDKFIIEKLPLEEFQKTVPAGMGEIAEYV